MSDRVFGAHGHSDLLAWQKAMDFATAVLELCERIPAPSGAGLVSQPSRAAVSVPSNIAEETFRRRKGTRLAWRTSCRAPPDAWPLTPSVVA